MYTEEHLYSIALRRCKLIGDIHFHQLVKIVGSAKEVWKQAQKKFKDFEEVKGKKLTDIGNMEHLKFAEKELQFCEKNKVNILLRHQHTFPFLLEQCEDAPAILYQKGSFPPVPKYISLVGTRKITPYGKDFLQDFFQEAKSQSFVSVSGLALGADTHVHRQSLKHRIPTIAVLAHGFQTLYPAKNRKLSEEIVEQGGTLITEFNSAQKPDREHFIQRNRVVAGLSSATIVVESAYAGGSISTATFANHYNREVFALPGKITDTLSQGCNQLIFANKARTIIHPKSLMKELQFPSNEPTVGKLFTEEVQPQSVPLHLKPIFEIIFQNPQISLDEMVVKTGFSTQKISGILLELELLGHIRANSGKQFSVI